MRDQRGPETEETTPRRDTAHRLRAIERWLRHMEDELLYTPDAPGEVAAPSCEPRYYHCWGAQGFGVLAILRFPVDARHPETQQRYGTYAVGDVFSFTYTEQPYRGRVIECLVSRVDGLIELHVQAAGEEAGAS